MKNTNPVAQILCILLLIISNCSKDDDPAKKVLASPSNLSATPFSATQISLTWVDKTTGEAGFKIERAAGGTTSFSEIASVSSAVTSYQNTGLVANTLYVYRVKAFSSTSNSPYSNSTSATTLDTSPVAPTNLTTTVFSPSQINLTWTDNSGNEAGFKIERAPGNTTTFTEIVTVGPGVTSYNNTGLSGNTGYSYRVSAYNATGTSAYSNTATATTTEIPAAPTTLTATSVSDTQINLTWIDNSSHEEGFKIERAPGSTTTFTEIGTVGAGLVTYNNTGLTANTTYSYRVTAYNATGNSTYSNIATATTTTIPAAPTTLTAVRALASGTQINLTWTDNSNNEDGFKIERAPGNTTTFAEIGTVNADVEEYNNSGLPANTSYSYRVKAFNTAGNSAYSNIATGSTQPLLEAPAISAPTTSSGFITIRLTHSWPCGTPCYRNTSDMYQLEQSTTSSSSGFSIAHTSVNGTRTSPYNITLPRAPGIYYFRARVNNNMVWSPYSTVIQVTVTAISRSITLINNCASTQFLNEVVQVKVSTTLNGVYVRPDLLTDDNGPCLSLPGESIQRLSSQRFNIPAGDSYYVFIGMGRWEVENYVCSSARPWFKQRLSTDVATNISYYIWRVILVNGHSTGNLNWTINGSLGVGDLRITGDSFSAPGVLFSRTTKDPIP